SVLRRLKADDEEPARFGPLEIDFGGQTVRVGGEPIALTKREYQLLAFLAREQAEWRRQKQDEAGAGPAEET
ncbi:MAG: DNA-binding response regulator, partial [Myxococcota bacterium]